VFFFFNRGAATPRRPSFPSARFVGLDAGGFLGGHPWPNLFSFVHANASRRERRSARGRGPAKSELPPVDLDQVRATRVLGGVRRAHAGDGRCCRKMGVTAGRQREPRLPTGRSPQGVGPDHGSTTGESWMGVTAQDHHL
jgi:hypothetical protein